LAGLYTMRVIAGTEAAALELSTWMLAFSVFLFLSLAAVKRQAELVDAAAREKPVIPGRGYAPTDLPVVEMMAIAAGYNAVLVLALYISSPDTVGLYLSPTLLWGACPVLLYWISRMVMVAHKGGMDDDPLIFAVRDRVSQGCGVLVLACGLAATFL
ncbi:MAG: prenyltransferase, partial [Pseudomonadota bacterium]